MVQENVSCLCGPLDVSNKGVIFMSFGLADRENVNGTENPESSPDQFDKEHNSWQSKNFLVVLDVHRCSLENSDTQLNGIVAAAHQNKNNRVESPQNVSSPLQVVVVRVFRIVFTRFVE